MPLQRWVRVARTPKAFQLEEQLKILEYRIKRGEKTVAEAEHDHGVWVAALRRQNQIHAFRD